MVQHEVLCSNSVSIFYAIIVTFFNHLLIIVLFQTTYVIVSFSNGLTINVSFFKRSSKVWKNYQMNFTLAEIQTDDPLDQKKI